MDLAGLLRQSQELVSVQLRGPRVVLLLGIRRVAVVLAKEGAGVGISTDLQSIISIYVDFDITTTHLHGSQLRPIPVCVKIRRADERQVDAQRAMNSAAIDANEDSVGHGGPRRVLGIAIEANLAVGWEK